MLTEREKLLLESRYNDKIKDKSESKNKFDSFVEKMEFFLEAKWNDYYDEEGDINGEISSIKVKWNKNKVDIYWLPKSKEIIADLPNNQLIATGTKSAANTVADLIKSTKSEDDAVDLLKDEHSFMYESADKSIDESKEYVKVSDAVASGFIAYRKWMKKNSASKELMAKYQELRTTFDELEQQVEVELLNESSILEKSPAAKMVLQLMDSEEDPDYATSVAKALDKYPKVKKDSLEKELKKYI